MSTGSPFRYRPGGNNLGCGTIIFGILVGAAILIVISLFIQ